MTGGKKILGEERRNLILDWLKLSDKPLTGSYIAEKVNVSRQVISQDITLLKARNEPIIATSQGYLYLKEQQYSRPSRVIISTHNPEQTKEELYLMVDCGVTVKDVKVEHPLYGNLTAPIGVSNRSDVDQFYEKVKATKAPLLLQLTGGPHSHTIEADNEEQLEQAIQKLTAAGFIMKNATST
ncbi:transcription repressor NadR [Schinkia azotoformans]|uniref:Transcriptional regulator n=1 Tax=Schinkia azotoformans LMG 9581 TaxID=1131731 RepID=K6CXI6_SCHAZ|nr:transcription repressor NadR [Schinkia azotoformans]EKN64952.1 transcriptional regulator [Schinkia azotoformans LMG 9581]MEC1640272.1 transcription repressor NadR [Schinkia azotoformans]MEC1720319.1 transcription repressor NadR [Schinkia azotoformans]MEC1945621.1 transcription repressor NadR [Schinkia azotoformans]MED4353757.1 transcription repressor NadR [Schinkia azotoformans]